MASQGQGGAPGQRPPRHGVDLRTLVLTAVASAAAAYISSRLWAPGTLVAAAMTPVIVALVREALERPAEVITTAVPTRRGRTGQTTTVDAVPGPPEAPDAVPRPAEHTPTTVYRVARRRRLRWRLAVLTGALGFLVCAVVYTVPELIAGDSVGRDGSGTTLWGGPTRDRDDSSPSTTTTTGTSTTPSTTETTPDETSTVTQTVTVPTPSAATPPASAATPGSSAAPGSTAAPGAATTP